MSINHVQIIYPSMGKSPQITINGDELSRYSELADYIDDDIFTLAEKLYCFLDAELCEDYEISIVGHEIHYQFLSFFQLNSKHCKNIEFHRIQRRIPLLEKFSYAFEQAEKLNLDIRKCTPRIEICCPSKEQFCSYGINNATYTSAFSNYYLSEDGDVFNVTSKYIISISDEIQVLRLDKSIVIKVPVRFLNDLIDYFNCYHVWIDYISEFFMVTSANAVQLDRLQAAEREAYLEDKAVVLVDDLPSVVDSGERIDVKIYAFPKCLPSPEFRLELSNPSIFKVNALSLIPVSDGESAVSILGNDGKKYYEKVLRVYKHTYVKSIKIIAPKTELQIHEMTSFRCVLQPSNAEDANSVLYRSSDERVLIVSANNEVYAVGAGRATLTAYTKITSGNLDFVVFAKPEKVNVTPSFVNINFNGFAELACSFYPQDISPKPTVTWHSSNPNIVKIHTAVGYNCRVYCVGLGEADIICQIDGSDIVGKAHVSTPPPKKRCYVATAVYGTYDCPQLWTLRRFRDDYLEKHFLGRAFIHTYYSISPLIIQIFGNTKWFNRIWRKRLDKFTSYLMQKGFIDTPYTD